MAEKAKNIQTEKLESPKSGAVSHRAVIGEILKGITYFGVAYLLGGCELFFSTLPLGVALLCASSAHTWYILAGLILSSITLKSISPAWTLIALYVITVLLRIGMLLIADNGHKPLPHGVNVVAGDDMSDKRDKHSLRRDAKYLLSSWASFLGIFSKNSPSEDDIRSDYYPGSMFSKNPPAERESSEEAPAHKLLFCENIFLRMMASVLAAFALGVSRMIIGGFQIYDLCGTIFLLFSVPVLTFFLSPVFGAEGERLLFASEPERRISKKISFAIFPTIAAALLTASVIYAARPISLSVLPLPFFTILLSPMLALLLTVLFSKRLGLIAGMAAAVVCGLACDPSLTPVLILSAAAYTMICPISAKIAAVVAITSTVAFTYLYTGLDKALAIIPSAVVAATLFFVCERLTSLIPFEKLTAEEMNDFTAAVTYETRIAANEARMRSLSAALTSLSVIFTDLSEKLKHPRRTDMENICLDAFREHCSRCPLAARHGEEDRCRGCEIRKNLFEDLATELTENGTIDKEKCKSISVFSSACPSINDIISEINEKAAELSCRLAKSEKAEVYASDYSAMAEIIKNNIESTYNSLRPDTQKADRIYDYLTDMGLEVRGVSVCADSRNCNVTIRARRFEKVADKAVSICAEIEKICESKLCSPTFDKDGECYVMVMASTATLTTRYSGSALSASRTDDRALYSPLTDDEKTRNTYSPAPDCGDHIAIFSSDNDYFYALISDGMGSGEDAALTSDICTVFLREMLCAGSGVDISMRMLNDIIRSKNNATGDECSATVDIFELDLISGHALFVKSGATPTYIVRAGKVYKITAGTMPIGIFKEPSHEVMHFRMHPGDVVVMVSDGVTLGNDECPWLVDMLKNDLPASMDRLRLDILRRAIASGSADDLSAIAVRVEDEARGNVMNS